MDLIKPLGSASGSGFALSPFHRWGSQDAEERREGGPKIQDSHL